MTHRKASPHYLAFVILLFIPILGCGSEETRWEKAKQTNTAETYKAFMGKYPESQYGLEAKSRIEKLEWFDAKSKHTAEAYKSFLAKYADSKYGSEAKSKTEELEWSDAQAKNTLEDYRQYAGTYPASNRVLRTIGQFTGRSIMIGDDGELLTGMFGSKPPRFEIRSNASPKLIYQMSVGDAMRSGLLKNGRLELAGNYTYTNGEMIVIVTKRGDEEVHTLIFFNYDQSVFAKDDGKVISSKARTLQVVLLSPTSIGK